MWDHAIQLQPLTICTGFSVFCTVKKKPCGKANLATSRYVVTVFWIVSMIWINKSRFTGCDNTVGFSKSGYMCKCSCSPPSTQWNILIQCTPNNVLIRLFKLMNTLGILRTLAAQLDSTWLCQMLRVCYFYFLSKLKYFHV